MTNNPTSEKLTFIELIKKYTKIEIPIIQRDYAQGREGKEELRENLLSTLLEAVESKEIELDFIYGSVKNNIFYPLDGQQRLTTLFLLHWFIACKENKLEDNEIKEILTKFTYETRTSSREFCEELINKGITYEKGQTISEQIKDNSWFFLSWKKDPTIKAMLTMLDAIEKKFKDTKEIWNKLNRITFQYIELENFGLSDDLYIKMNARGKALTPFENFKANFEQYIKQNGWENNVKPNETFAHKIDTEWTDLFWKYRDDKNIFDEKLLKFIANVIILYYAQNLEIYDDDNEKEDIKNKNKNITDDAIKRERIERRITKLSGNCNEIQVKDFVTKQGFEYLKRSLDIYYQNDNLYANLSLWDCKDSNLFKCLVEDELTYRQRVLFYAQTEYLSCNNYTENFFNDWMRVVRNVVENSTIDSAVSFVGAIRLVKELSNGCSDIYRYLSDNKINSGHASEQMREEVRKAKLIVNNSKIKPILFELEDTSFCKGLINWCLECSEEVLELVKINEIIKSHLNQNDISNLFRRALLTIGDNKFYGYWHSWSYSTETHKRCLIESRNDLKKNFIRGDKFENYLKKLVLQLCINNDLQCIIDEYNCPDTMPNWKIRLIKEPNLLEDHCKGHYIGITADNKQCYLFDWKKRPISRDECYLVE